MSEYFIHGKVLNEITQGGISGLRVELWNKNPIQDDLIGNDFTDQQGSFKIEFKSKYSNELCFDRELEIYFKVFFGKRLLKTTEPPVLWNVKEVNKSVTLHVKVIDNGNDVSPMNNFIPAENINTIYEAIALVWPDSSQQEKQRAIVKSVECEAGALGLLWSDARDFLHGDIMAGNRLIAQLNTLPLNTSVFTKLGTSDPDSHIQSISGEIGFMPNPRMRGSMSICLFPAPRLIDIYLGIARVVAQIPNAPTELVDSYFRRVQSLVEHLAPLEQVHVAARLVIDDLPRAKNYFIALMGCMGKSESIHRQPTSMSFGELPESPIRPGPHLILDFCRFERYEESGLAVQCFRQLQEGPKYEIDDIVNIVTGVSRRGCVDHEIEIRGRNLGRRGQIIFAHDIEATTLVWTDSSIRFIVPAGASSGNIGILIDPEIDKCVRFPNVYRLPAEGTDNSFEFVRVPEIDWFNLQGSALTGIPTGPNQYEVEACTDIILNTSVRYAERAVIRDSMDNVVWDSGEGEPRTINTLTLPPIVLINLQEDVTLTLEVSNLCRLIHHVVELNIYKAVHLTAPARVRASESFDLSISISCPSPDDGTSVSLSGPFTLPDGPVVIAAGETTTIVTLLAIATCAELEISASAPYHREDSVDILIFDTPRITDVTPMEGSACSSFSLDIRGDCFDPTSAGNNVRVTNGVENVLLSVMSIRFLDPTNHGRDAVLEVRGTNILPGSWEIFVESHGLTSTRFAAPLVIRSIPAQIHNFSSSLLGITPCVDNILELRWEVSNIERVEISSGGRNVVTRSYGPTCTRRSDFASLTVNEATSYLLSAFPIGGGAPVSSPLRVDEINFLQREEVRVENWTRGDYFPEHTLTIWQEDITNGARINRGTILHEEGITIPLAHCHLHRVYAVSHEWIADHNHRFGTRFNANDSSIVDYPQFHKITIPGPDIRNFVLGRNGKGRETIRIEPVG
ncbi:hypothetical protein BROC_00362 [Candidatus Brocadiaceae bacterium]|nr:hypothetical protein BROC_00362 [Candidatus Brocadiaceae bacterium]